MKCFLIKSSLGMQRGPGLLFSHCDLQPQGWNSKGWSNFLPNGVNMGEEDQRLLRYSNKEKKWSMFSRWQRNTPFDKLSLLAFLISNWFFKVLLKAGCGPDHTTARLWRHPERHIVPGLSSIVFLKHVSRQPSPIFIVNLAVLEIWNAIIMIKDLSVRKWISETRHSC